MVYVGRELLWKVPELSGTFLSVFLCLCNTFNIQYRLCLDAVSHLLDSDVI